MTKNNATHSKTSKHLLGERQLFQTLPGFIAPTHYAAGKLFTRSASNIPFVLWPNGEPCQIANLYMLSLLKQRGRGGRQGLALKGSKGGTLGNYASKVSQLLRYCCRHNSEILEITDGFFCEFMDWLREEKNRNNLELPRKTSNSVDETGRVCLKFLQYAGAFYGNDQFVAVGGNINIEYREKRIKTRSGRIAISTYIHHHSFSAGSAVKSRNPVPSAHISSLRKAADEIKSTRFINRRRSIMISLLESIGCRRGELTDILVDDIFNADSQNDPLLILTNLKHADGSQRSVPISKMLLRDVKKYIRLFRRPIIEHTLGASNDHGYLFISETTGRRLEDNTITSEISKLRKFADIPEKVCAHMFRHAYITRLFMTMIERHKFENEDKLRLALVTWDKFAADMMQWTGHTDITSLFRYIHIAYSELSDYPSIASSVHLVGILRTYDTQLDALVSSMLDDATADKFRVELAQLRLLRNQDISISDRRAGSPSGIDVV